MILEEQKKFFKMYAIENGLTKKFAFGSVIDGKKQLIFLNNETSTHIAYKGIKVKDGVLYSTSPATCGYGIGESDENGLCNIGVPNTKCIASKIYSENNCAVYFIEEVDLQNFKYRLTAEKMFALVEKFKENN
jgi:hypothetical protein